MLSFGNNTELERLSLPYRSRALTMPSSSSSNFKTPPNPNFLNEAAYLFKLFYELLPVASTFSTPLLYLLILRFAPDIYRPR